VVVGHEVVEVVDDEVGEVVEVVDDETAVVEVDPVPLTVTDAKSFAAVSD